MRSALNATHSGIAYIFFFGLEGHRPRPRGGGVGVLPQILDRGVPRRFLKPNPI